MTAKSILVDRQQLVDQVAQSIKEILANQGLVLDSFSINDVQDPTVSTSATSPPRSAPTRLRSPRSRGPSPTVSPSRAASRTAGRSSSNSANSTSSAKPPARQPTAPRPRPTRSAPRGSRAASRPGGEGQRGRRPAGQAARHRARRRGPPPCRGRVAAAQQRAAAKKAGDHRRGRGAPRASASPVRPRRRLWRCAPRRWANWTRSVSSSWCCPSCPTSSGSGRAAGEANITLVGDSVGPLTRSAGAGLAGGLRSSGDHRDRRRRALVRSERQGRRPEARRRREGLNERATA